MNRPSPGYALRPCMMKQTMTNTENSQRFTLNSSTAAKPLVFLCLAQDSSQSHSIRLTELKRA